jgi:hypothetical protein
MNTIKGIGSYEEVECTAANLIIIPEETPIDGFDLLSLILCTLTMDMRQLLSTYFKEQPAFIYVDYEDEGYLYKYAAVICKNGFTKETLHEVNSDGTYTQIPLGKANQFYSNLTPSYDNFFRELVYFNYINVDDMTHLKAEIDNGIYVCYCDMIRAGSELWDNYMCNLVSVMRKLGSLDVKDIVFADSGTQIYFEEDDKNDYSYLWQQSETFVNTFFIAVCILEAVMYGKLLFLTSVDKYQEKLASRIYRVFEEATKETRGAQLFMSCYPTMLERVTVPNEQVFRTLQHKTV